MKRYVPGLHGARQNADADFEGLFLVRVERAFYRWHPQKPFFTLCLSVLEPKEYAGRTISGRLYSTPRALWKLSWFLRDFGYDTDLLGRDEVDERALRGLRGVARISHTVLSGRCFLNLERFAPAADWEELSMTLVGTADRQEAAHDL
jgi:hypothetical protein